MKIYAASLVIVHENNELDHHLFCFSLWDEATTTPEDNAESLCKGLLPRREGAFRHRIEIMEVDVKYPMPKGRGLFLSRKT